MKKDSVAREVNFKDLESSEISLDRKKVILGISRSTEYDFPRALLIDHNSTLILSRIKTELGDLITVR